MLPALLIAGTSVLVSAIRTIASIIFALRADCRDRMEHAWKKAERESSVDNAQGRSSNPLD